MFVFCFFIHQRKWGFFTTHIKISVFLSFPVRDMPVDQCSKQTCLYPRIFMVDGPDELFDIFTSGCSICRTWIFYYRKVVFIFKSDNICFLHIQKRTDNGQFHAVQIGFWWETVKMSFVNHGHHHCFNKIILVMRISDFIAVKLFDCVV